MSNMLLRAPLEHEPLRQNRFIMRFPSDLGISEWTVESASRPKMTIGNTEIPFLNTSTYVAGRYKWEQMQVSFRDFTSPSTMQAVMEWIRLCAESVTGRMGYAVGYKRDVVLEMLDPTGVVIQKWILKNAWLSNVDGGNLNYSQDGVATISATLIIDYAIMAF